MHTTQRVVVVGGGIAGLATAHFLAETGNPDRTAGGPPRIRVTLVEAEDHLGGKIRTRSIAGRPVDLGPDAVMVRSEEVRRFLADLGLNGSIIEPGASGASVWSAGQLRPLPEGTMFGVPGRIGPVVRSRLLSPLGLARAGLDLVLPRFGLPEDPTVAQVVRPRFGSQVFDRLIEPLLGGVYAGQASLLSARSTLPEIDALARRKRSLYLALRKTVGRSGRGQTLVSLDRGMSALVEAIAADLEGVRVLTGTRATALAVETTVEPTAEQTRLGAAGSDSAGQRPEGRPVYHLSLDNGETIPADAVVFATPAYATAPLLAGVAPKVADFLRGIPYADVATITMIYPPTIAPALTGTGFLVPPADGRLIVGATWVGRKWPRTAATQATIVRCAVGRYGDTAPLGSDAELVTGVQRELAEALGLSVSSQYAHVQRWPKGLPQYVVGHADRLAAIRSGLAALPGLYVTGSSYTGIGIAACVINGRSTARAVLEQLGATPGATAGAPATDSATTDPTAAAEAAKEVVA